MAQCRPHRLLRDLSVALHYYNAQDKWQDDHNLLALGYSTLLDNSTAEAALRWPRQCNAIRACLAKLAEYEPPAALTLTRCPAASVL